MPFRLTNASGVFMDLMNQVCKLYLDKFNIVFIDDILIYSKSKEDQEVHLRKVVNDNRIYVDLIKIKVVKNWKAPKSPSEIQSFLGLTGKANVVADALSRKERVKPRRVRAMSMTIQSGVKHKILKAQSEASKKRMADANLQVPLNEIKIDNNFRFVEEPVEIMDYEVKKLKCSKISIVKIVAVFGGLEVVLLRIIDDELFDRLRNDDAVSLCCLGILQLVLLGVEGKRRIPNWMLRLENDRVGNLPAARLTPDETEARSD
uniref:Reverse transcriptase domain-containing protein n=1 Tax=Tanacetum cinerariifolium TaxID=118510 RepID=A0A699I1I7_TANCI|nr:hypothetical protein [Tanacetum cinerariifolium]